MFRKMVGLAFLMAGRGVIAASSVCGSRASCAGDAGLRSPQALQARLMRAEEQTARHTSNAKAVQPSRGQSGKDIGRAQRQRAFTSQLVLQWNRQADIACYHLPKNNYSYRQNCNKNECLAGNIPVIKSSLFRVGRGGGGGGGEGEERMEESSHA